MADSSRLSNRDVNFALVTDESLFKEKGKESHVSAFQELAESKEGASLKANDDDDDEPRNRRTSFIGLRDSLDVVRAHASRAIRRSTSVFSFPRDRDSGEAGWVRADKGLSQLTVDDIEHVNELLEVSQRYDNGKLYIRKAHIGVHRENVKWQVKFKHPTRGIEKQADTLKNAVGKVKSFLDFSEPGELDERFQRLFEIIRTDKRYKDALILFKEGGSKDYYPWKVRIHHPKHSWTRVCNTLIEAIQEMEDHLEYEEATPEERDGQIWERVFTALEKHPRCKVFFKELSEPGPDGEPEKVWLVKVDHPTHGVQFETKSRILEEAVGQVYDYLAGKRGVAKA